MMQNINPEIVWIFFDGLRVHRVQDWRNGGRNEQGDKRQSQCSQTVQRIGINPEEEDKNRF
jgi:hypothetical protein